MTIRFHKIFTKHFDKRIQPNKKLLNAFDKRYILFLSDPQHILLKNHALTGDMKGLRAFSITGDIRVIYRLLDKKIIEFLDIGTHAQVYRQ